MARKVVRTMEAYSIHGHIRPGAEEEELLDYAPFFQTLMKATLTDLRFPVRGDTVAIADKVWSNEKIALRFVTGNSSELPLVYDASTGIAESVDPGKHRLVVNSAWVIVFPERRLIILERKRPGVPIHQIESFFKEYGQNRLGYSSFTVSLNPVPSQSFALEVKQFTRIREASITLKRPNHSWTTSAQELLGELTESNAGAVQLQLNADRGGSLSKSRGVVQEIINLSGNPVNALKNAVIRGQAPGFEGERSVSLQRHKVKGSTNLDPLASPRGQLEPLSELADRLAEETLHTDHIEVGEE